jgi:hypothetical protein
MKVNVVTAATLTPLFNFSLIDWQSICGRVKAICLDDKNNFIYVGTLGSEIYQAKIDFTKKLVAAPKVLLNGHYCPSTKDNNEVWGLVPHPKLN